LGTGDSLRGKAEASPQRLGASQFKTMVQNQDKLILRFANKHALVSLKIDDSFRLKQLKLQSEKQKLESNLNQLQLKLKSLKQDDALTPEGRAMLLSPQDKLKHESELNHTQLQLDDVILKLKELDLKLKKAELNFEGWVKIRRF
jgi:hypothetical protein